MINENIDFDAIIKAACEQIIDEEVAYYDRHEVPEIEISSAATRKFKKALRCALFKSSRGYKVLKFAAVACLVVASLAVWTVVAVEPAREYIWGVITKWYDDCIEVVFNKDSNTEYPKNVKEDVFELPDGWLIELNSTEGDIGSYTITTADQNKIIYSVFTSGADIFLDNTEYIEEEVKLSDGSSAYLYTYKNGLYVLVWKDEYIRKAQSYSVDGEELVFLANLVEE